MLISEGQKNRRDFMRFYRQISHVKMRCLCIIGILYLTTSTSGEEPKIVIIGAGAAGIAAASKLFENGFKDVIILEAENRIGGRVYTAKFDDSWIDLGGQWVDGQTDNIAYELASPHGLLDVPEEDGYLQFAVYDSEGVHVPDSIGGNLTEFFANAYTDSDSVDDDNVTVGEYYRRLMTVEAERYQTVDETRLNQVMKLFEGMSMITEATDSWFEPSMKGFRESWSCPGSPIVNWKDRGYGTILDILMKKFPNPEEELPVLNNTLLNSEVVNVDYQSTEGKALVETGSGDKFTADHVIVTPSLGVLKEQYQTLFTPQLPESKVKTIRGLNYGTMAKIYLSFEAPWWPNNSPHLVFIWDEDDRREYESDAERKWLVDVIGVFMVAHRPRLLCGWVGGASSRHMETLSEEQVLNQIFALMNRFLGNSYNVTRPTGIKRTSWYSNKHFRGTYSGRSMETERADVWMDELATPLLVNEKPVVMFAGEATHAHYYGYVHGAIETGFREANRLIGIYKNSTE